MSFLQKQSNYLTDIQYGLNKKSCPGSETNTSHIAILQSINTMAHRYSHVNLVVHLKICICLPENLACSPGNFICSPKKIHLLT